MPLVGERLVAFLSDGASWKRRGSDWTPRWWRAEDSGPVMPIMIKQWPAPSTSAPHVPGGRDRVVRPSTRGSTASIRSCSTAEIPAAFAWAIFEMERRLTAAADAVGPDAPVSVALPYGIAVRPRARASTARERTSRHNLPLGGDPHVDPVAARHFKPGTRRSGCRCPTWAAARALQHTRGRATAKSVIPAGPS